MEIKEQDILQTIQGDGSQNHLQTFEMPETPVLVKETLLNSNEECAGVSVLVVIGYESLTGHIKNREFLIRRVIQNKNEYYLDGVAMDIQMPRLIRVKQISYIQENMPSSRILVMTPTQRYKVDGKDGNTKNNAGLTIKNYCQIIKNVCEDHSVPCLDLYSTSLLYPYSAANSTEYFADDGAHINDNGHKLVFEAMTEKTTSLLALK